MLDLDKLTSIDFTYIGDEDDNEICWRSYVKIKLNNLVFDWGCFFDPSREKYDFFCCIRKDMNKPSNICKRNLKYYIASQHKIKHSMSNHEYIKVLRKIANMANFTEKVDQDIHLPIIFNIILWIFENEATKEYVPC